MRRFLFLPIVIVLLSCSDPKAHQSGIVRELERAGAGDVSGSTPPEIAMWFSQHPKKKAVLDRINVQCQPLRVQADTNWTLRTAEGRICFVAQQLATPPVYGANPKGY